MRNSILRYMICNYFLQICGLSFPSFNSTFQRVKILNFMKSNLSHFSFMDHTLCVRYQRNLCLTQRLNNFLLCLFFSRSFKALGSTAKLRIYFDFFFVWCKVCLKVLWGRGALSNHRDTICC